MISQRTIDEVGSASPIYYRILKGGDGWPLIVEMQWFDESGYDQKQFLTERQFDTEAKAAEFIRDKQAESRRWFA